MPWKPHRLLSWQDILQQSRSVAPLRFSVPARARCIGSTPRREQQTGDSPEYGASSEPPAQVERAVSQLRGSKFKAASAHPSLQNDAQSQQTLGTPTYNVPGETSSTTAEHESSKLIPNVTRWKIQHGLVDHALKDEIKLSGLVQSIRRQKNAAFAHISDGTTLAGYQAVLSPEQALPVTNGSYVELKGRWQESQGRGQSHELQVGQVLAIGPSNPEENPIQKKFQSAEHLRTVPHLRTRTPFHSLLARVRSAVLESSRKHLYAHSSTEVHPPIITSSDCEGAGEVFSITPRTSAKAVTAGDEAQQYFREPKYLTVSSQLHLEALAAELGSVFTLSPTFRAEESDTPRHLSEFYMLEVEYRGIISLDILTSRAEKLIKSIVKDLQCHGTADELLRYHADAKHGREGSQVDLISRWESLDGSLSNTEWKRFRHETVVTNLLDADSTTTTKGRLFKTRPSYTNGLQLEHERWIVDELGGGKPVFVTHYPKPAKPFYMLPSPGGPSDQGIETVACFDLLLPFGYAEVAGGSLREHRLEHLISSMRERGMLKKRDPGNKRAKPSDQYPFLRPDETLGPLQWYADLRRYGTSPHGGFGLGFDRLLAYLTGVSNLRDVVAFPRTWGRADC